AFSFADGMGHWFFAPDIFTCQRCVYRHDAVPVRRSGNMYNIYFRKLNKFAVIMKSFYAFIQHTGRNAEVPLVYIADSNNPCSFIFKMVPPHCTYTDDAFGKLVAGCYVTFT